MAEPSYERPSRTLQMTDTLATLRNLSGVSKPKQSRLELIRQNYEKKRQKDIEERLSKMRFQQAQEESGKVKSGPGTVRAFFAERRAMEATMKDPYALPPIDRHFRKVKDSSSSAPLRQVRARESYKPPVQHTSKSAGLRRPMPQYHSKKSKGIDKQNPLPPLQKGENIVNKPPTPNKRYETHHTFTGDISLDKTESEVKHANNIYVPKPPNKANQFKAQCSRADSISDFDEVDSIHSEDTPPNLAKLKALRQKRLKKKLSIVSQESTDKPSDFQKWQMDQDRQRAERLQKHAQKTQNKAGENLSSREHELLEKIKAEQDKLKEIKRLQQELEDKERIESEEEDSYESYDAEKHSQIVQKTHQKLETAIESTKQIETQAKKERVKHKEIQKPLSPEHPMQEETNEIREDFTEFYERAAAQNDESVNVDLSSCTICGRKFAIDRLPRHEKICNKNSTSKRKKFDVQKQRVSGMEHAKYVLTGDYKKEPKKARKADWRAQHENFIKTIRYAKGASDEPPPAMNNSHYVACPYCERKFNPETAERHIPRCKDIKSRPAPPKANSKRKR